MRRKVVTHTRLLHHVSFLDLVSGTNLYILARDVIVVLFLCLEGGEVRPLAVLAAHRLVLRLTRLNSNLLLSTLVTAQLILLQLHSRNLLKCPILGDHAVAWEVFGPSLASDFVDLRNFFPNSI